MIRPTFSFVFLVIVIVTETGFGQALSPRPEDANRTAVTGYSYGFPARGGSVDVGLALSGGGIRSGSYSIGVMKKLFDDNILDKVDVVSSVSGGGYAVYWMILRENESGHPRFGQQSFGENFLRNSCELQQNSRMYPFFTMLRNLPFSTRQYNKYKGAIDRTFGLNGNDHPDLSSFNSFISDSGMPYIIFNTTQFPESPKIEASVELTPRHIGNDKLGRTPWSVSKPGGTLLDAITTSAAGDKSIRQPYSTEDGGIELYDGGCSENLAALPLIRSGLQHVIIVDAEHDPKLEFGSYWKLKKVLLNFNIDLEVVGIQGLSEEQKKYPDPCPSIWKQARYKSPNKKEIKHVKEAYMPGTAKNKETGAVISQIHYLKLSQSEDVFPTKLKKLIEGSKLTRDKREKAVQAEFESGFRISLDFEARTKTFTSPTKYYSNCNCAVLPASEPGKASVLEEMYRYQVNRYMYFFAQLRKPKLLSGFGDSLQYDFPHTTTATQSFAPDQMEAFIGLGYLQAKPLTDAFKKMP